MPKATLSLQTCCSLISRFQFTFLTKSTTPNQFSITSGVYLYVSLWSGGNISRLPYSFYRTQNENLFVLLLEHESLKVKQLAWKLFHNRRRHSYSNDSRKTEYRVTFKPKLPIVCQHRGLVTATNLLVSHFILTNSIAQFYTHLIKRKANKHLLQ